MKVEGPFLTLQSPTGTDSGSIPSNDVDMTGESSQTKHVESTEHDELGTTVTEVTIVTTRKKYRVADA